MHVARPARVVIVCRTLLWVAASLPALLLSPTRLPAQNVCEVGNRPLTSDPPAGIATAEIIRQFAAKDTIFKKAREQYSYELDITAQTLTNSDQIDGAFRQISDFAPGKNAVPVETVTYAPESTLRRLSLDQNDFDAIHSPVMLTTEELPSYSVDYLGRQHVDTLDTYVFKVAPRDAKGEKKLFAGRVWVDAQDLMIVKTCGKPRADVVPRSAKKGFADLSPMFVTYREEIDGRFWFPTYAKADDFLDFPRGEVHIREVIRYSNYKAAPNWDQAKPGAKAAVK
jgi:hypothetical protein